MKHSVGTKIREFESHPDGCRQSSN